MHFNRNKQLYVPCKKCIPCKINHTSEWSLRLMMELENWKSARFVTLTYNNANLPENKTLVKDDFKDFMKAFRQNLDGRFIKYFACGEYGDDEETDENPLCGKRPHYHFICFGIDDSLEDRTAIFNAWKKCDEFQFFGKNWRKTVGTVTQDSCNYVAGYCQKKLFGEMAEVEYIKKGKIPPFQLQSNHIGEDYFLEHIEQYKKDGYILFHGVKHPIPETWKRKYNIISPYSDVIEKEEMEKYLLEHPDVSEEYYKWVSYNFGVTLQQDDINSYFQRNNYKELVQAKNNLNKKKRGL